MGVRRERSCAAAVTARIHWHQWLDYESSTFADAPWSLSVPHMGVLSANTGLIAHRSWVYSTDPLVTVASLP
jgi:hypothetical protein